MLKNGKKKKIKSKISEIGNKVNVFALRVSVCLCDYRIGLMKISDDNHSVRQAEHKVVYAIYAFCM